MHRGLRALVNPWSVYHATRTPKDLLNWCHCELRKLRGNVYVCEYDSFRKGERNFVKKN